MRRAIVASRLGRLGLLCLNCFGALGFSGRPATHLGCSSWDTKVKTRTAFPSPTTLSTTLPILPTLPTLSTLSTTLPTTLTLGTHLKQLQQPGRQRKPAIDTEDSVGDGDAQAAAMHADAVGITRAVVPLQQLPEQDPVGRGAGAELRLAQKPFALLGLREAWQDVVCGGSQLRCTAASRSTCDSKGVVSYRGQRLWQPTGRQENTQAHSQTGI